MQERGGQWRSRSRRSNGHSAASCQRSGKTQETATGRVVIAWRPNCTEWQHLVGDWPVGNSRDLRSGGRLAHERKPMAYGDHRSSVLSGLFAIPTPSPCEGHRAANVSACRRRLSFSRVSKGTRLRRLAFATAQPIKRNRLRAQSRAGITRRVAEAAKRWSYRSSADASASFAVFGS